MDNESGAKGTNVKWLISIIAIFLIVSALVGTAYWSFTTEYQDKIYPNVWVGKINIGGLTKDKAIKIINNQIDAINRNGIVFSYQGHKTVLLPTIISLDGEFTEQVINFDPAQTATQAFAIGRSSNLWKNLSEMILSVSRRRQITLIASLDQDKIKSALQNELSTYEVPAQDAKLQVNYDLANNKYIFSVSPEADGQMADYDSGLAKLAANLADLNNSQIILNGSRQEPLLHQADCLNINAAANNLLGKTPVTLVYNDQSFIIHKKAFAKLLNLQKINSQTTVGIDRALLQQYLQDNFSAKINLAAQNSKFTIAGNKVVQFQSSRDGVELNLVSSTDRIINGLTNGSSTIALVADTVKSEVQDTDANNLGIKEIIGTGKSNFAGSSNSRRHNIKVGADTLSGLLIKPDEEFSTTKALGAIDAAAGYLPELVIKEGKTMPDYGGGLCQIGTTMFRSALASGLPITARRNHSYRVGYYEPAGTDATIYDPQPDLRFINDTGNYILIQARIEGNNLYFDFWGIKDGRTATATYPKIFNIVKPQPPLITETLNLKPGEKKCSEKAHNGADAYFDYSVIYSNGDKKETRFRSHYVPWREVCLVGVAKLSASSTAEAIIPTTTNNNPKTAN